MINGHRTPNPSHNPFVRCLVCHSKTFYYGGADTVLFTCKYIPIKALLMLQEEHEQHSCSKEF